MAVENSKGVLHVTLVTVTEIRTETSFEVDVAFFTKVVQSVFVGQRNLGWSWLCIGALKCPLAALRFITATTDAKTVLC